MHQTQHYVGAGANSTTVVASYNGSRYQHWPIVNNQESDRGTGDLIEVLIYMGLMVIFVLHLWLEVVIYHP